ncbi:MAE_28990/MAE_18760 family HEPN-like nuclease [Nocardia tengchongensis]|uniref:MAE_28990/MAE_18760 family HEPN-like nuclease n=1 Tax=Nocardia tengchongensis TaxID=2055889 RepID=UPI0036A8C121
MTLARETLDVRRQEVEQLLAYLKQSEEPSSLSRPDSPKGETLRILRSSCYMMIYSMVESTMSLCLQDLTSAVIRTASSIRDLKDEVFEHYLVSKYNSRLGPISREKGVSLVKEFMKELDQATIPEFTFASPSGNCNDKQIEKTMEVVGIKFTLDSGLKKRVKMFVTNERSTLDALVQVRNDLAHGNRTFSEVGQDCTEKDLRRIFDLSVDFLEVVIQHFEDYIEVSGYLKNLDGAENSFSDDAA